MPQPRFTSYQVMVTSVFILVAGCTSDTPAAKHDSLSTPGDSALPAARSRTASTWNAGAGPVLLVQGEASDDAIILLPDENDSSAVLATLGKGTNTALLLTRGGTPIAAQLELLPTSGENECRVARIRDARGSASPAGWSIGFLDQDVMPLALDSIEALSSRDSLALTAEAARLASGVTAVSPSFEGLRFVVHDVRRFESAPGIQTLVAHLIRAVNQEANPQEEHTLVIAERDSGITSGPYTLIYADRAHGLEEQVVAPEVIAGAHIGGRPTLVVARDSEGGVAYDLLERDASRHWRIRWASAPTRCG